MMLFVLSKTKKMFFVRYLVSLHQTSLLHPWYLRNHYIFQKVSLPLFPENSNILAPYNLTVIKSNILLIFYFISRLISYKNTELIYDAGDSVIYPPFIVFGESILQYSIVVWSLKILFYGFISYCISDTINIQMEQLSFQRSDQ